MKRIFSSSPEAGSAELLLVARPAERRDWELPSTVLEESCAIH